ncbi:MAG: hypothetical protein Ct9H300mP11_02350 [Chloroflexota bacterium]|nr:MAG: hypothetical protein Ct9H300mP11_02350 [Chloroflexota bacterium]
MGLDYNSRPQTYWGVIWSNRFLFLIFAGIEAGVIRLQLASAESDLIGPGRYNEMFTMHATTMVFMVIMPLSVSFFNIVIPLAIGPEMLLSLG